MPGYVFSYCTSSTTIGELGRLESQPSCINTSRVPANHSPGEAQEELDSGQRICPSVSSQWGGGGLSAGQFMILSGPVCLGPEPAGLLLRRMRQAKAKRDLIDKAHSSAASTLLVHFYFFCWYWWAVVDCSRRVYVFTIKYISVFANTHTHEYTNTHTRTRTNTRALNTDIYNHMK